MHAFEHQDSQQTLAQGIEEYFAANPGLAKGRNMTPEAAHFFQCHDAVHVVFGCGTTLDDEAVVKIASIFGTTEGFRVLKGYRLHESLDIYRQLRVADVLRSVMRSMVTVPRTLLRCHHQRALWPWADYQQYLHTPLYEMRQRFGITVAHPRDARNDA